MYLKLFFNYIISLKYIIVLGTAILRFLLVSIVLFYAIGLDNSAYISF